MQTLRDSLLVRRLMLPLTLAAFVSSCMRWSAVDTSPAAFLNAEQPDRVRITWQGRQYEIWSPEVRADSLVGQNEGRGQIAIPLSEVETLEERAVNGTATAVAVTAGALALLAAAGFIWLSNEEISR